MTEEPSRTNGGAGPWQVGTAITFEQKRSLAERAEAQGVKLPALLRSLVAAAPPASTLPESTESGVANVTMLFRDEETLRHLEEKRGDLKRGAYLRRVIEWGLRQ